MGFLDVPGMGRAQADLRFTPMRPANVRDGREELRRILSDFSARGGKKVTWIGDSITEQGRAGIGSGAGLGVGYTTFIEQAYPNITYNNQAIGGKTTLNILNDAGWLSAITATGADLYVLAIGINDARYNDARGATTQAAYIANITSIVNALVAAGGQVVIISIWPSFWKDQFAALGRKGTDDRFKQWNAALRNACKNTFNCPFIDAYTPIVKAIDFYNVTTLIPDGVHPDYAGTIGKKLYATAVLHGDVVKEDFNTWFTPTGTYGFKLRVLDNGQADGLCSSKMLKILPYYKDRSGFSADASVDPISVFGSYSGAYAGYKNKARDFPFDFIVTTDQWPTGFLHLSAGAFRGIRSYELYMSTDPRAFADPSHESWRLIQSEYTNRAVAFDLMPAKRVGVFYRLEFDDSTGTDGTGGTTGTFIKISKIWPGVNPVRFATSNFIGTSTGPYERADLVFSATGGDINAHFANASNAYPLHIMWESPQRVPSVQIASVNVDTGASARNIKNWKLFMSNDPMCINDPANASWKQIATGVGDSTIDISAFL